ncbi:hypothetical protein G6F35_017694 [Rhizopus arrhizus]|nr:hypothetical protein G6F35_017694 [Rhizopus arrhizus]
MSDLGEVEYGDIEVALVDAAGVPKLIDLLEQLGAPKGSQLQGAGEADRSFGVTEGLGIYLDGLTLPDEVYEQCDSNHLVAGPDRDRAVHVWRIVRGNA